MEYMISLNMILGLLFSHLIGDFFLQSDWMALNKSKNWLALLFHVVVYSICFLWLGPKFALMTAGFHFLTDAITSRITSKLWFIDLKRIPEPRLSWELDYEYLAHINHKRHWFFVAIGADQFIHYGTLLWTVKYLIG